MNGVPLIIGWKLCKRGPVIPLTKKYRVVRVEGLAKGDSIRVIGLVPDGEYVIGDIFDDGVWDMAFGSSRAVQAELVGQNGSEVFVWVE